MDNNATNDYIGPDGTLYDNAVKFAESCKQDLLQRDNEQDLLQNCRCLFKHLQLQKNNFEIQ